MNPPRYVFTQEEKDLQSEIATLRERMRAHMHRKVLQEVGWLEASQQKLEVLLLAYKHVKLQRKLKG